MDRISGPFILGMETANGIIATATTVGRLDLSCEYALISAARVVAEYFGGPGPSEHVLMQWMRSLFWDVFLNRSNVPAMRAAADRAESTPDTDWLGDPKTVHTDAEGNVVGETRDETSIFGQKRSYEK